MSETRLTVLILAIWAVVIALIIAAPTSAQTPPQPAADCTILFTLTTTGQATAAYNNVQNGCSIWSVNVYTTGFSAATVTFQSAPTASNTTAGTFVTWLNQDVIFGANPFVGASTGAAAGAWIIGYNPWARVILTSKTGSGTVSGSVFGYKKILR